MHILGTILKEVCGNVKGEYNTVDLVKDNTNTKPTVVLYYFKCKRKAITYYSSPAAI
jgi:hypothetical protein